jgi:glycosyltransferase involved in cell wall biosynthesis
MRALYFGTYDRTYPRNAQVISCLRKAGVDVVEAHTAVWGRHNWSVGLGQLARIARAETRLARQGARNADVVIVGYPGHFDMVAARRVARGRPVVFNPLVSLHDTLVDDRGRFRAGSGAAMVVRHIDRIAFRRSDVVVADTATHARFFRETFELAPERVEVALVGAEDRLFRPGWQPPQPFHALFVGKLIPLHGLDTILAAARLAPEIPFRIVGEGQLAADLADAPPNVASLGWVEYEDLPALYQGAGCALGIFGTSEKAGRVIPNKAFQAIACGRALVTADTPGARELLSHGENALLVPAGNPEALAEALRRLAEDPLLATRLGDAARATYEARAAETVLGAVWRSILERAVDG